MAHEGLQRHEKIMIR